MPQVRVRFLSVAVLIVTLSLLASNGASAVSLRADLAAKLPPSSHGQLLSVAAVPHSHDLWAIAENSQFKNMVVRRHHGKWARVSVTGPVGSSIAVGSANRVWITAGGGLDQLKGNHFVPVKIAVASGLGPVAASSATNAWTLGLGNRPGVGITALHWNGKSWVQVALPTGETDGCGLVATSGPRNVWMVCLDSAETGHILLHWNGKTWKATGTIPVEHTINAIASTAPNRAIVVGETTVSTSGNERTYSARYNGSKWVEIKTPNPGGDSTLRGLAMSGNRAWAVGLIATNISDHPLAMMTSGHGWKVEHLPATGSETYFNSASAASSKLVYAVGNRSTGPSSDSPLYGIAEQYNGHSWKVIPSKI
jgi:hypothetical protein